jgi:hypothetical protein
VPGAPRRLWLSSSPRRGAFGRLAALAVISVGRRFMGTLRVRTWRLCGANTKVRLMHHNKDSAGSVPDRVLPQIVGNSGASRFANPVPARPSPFNRPTQLRTIRGNLIGKLRISRNTSSRAALICTRQAQCAFKSRRPLDRDLAQLSCRAPRTAPKPARQERRNGPPNATLRGSAAFCLCPHARARLRDGLASPAAEEVAPA